MSPLLADYVNYEGSLGTVSHFCKNFFKSELADHMVQLPSGKLPQLWLRPLWLATRRCYVSQTAQLTTKLLVVASTTLAYEL